MTMKKLLLILVVIFATSVTFAQTKPQWGIKAGLNIASEDVDEASTKPRTGIHLGVFAEWTIGNMVDFQPELLYSMQGGKYKYSSTTYTDKIDYITLPLMFKFYVNQHRSFSIDVGPQFGYMVSAKYSNGSTTTNIYDRDSMNKFDASLGFGISYQLEGGFDLGLRFVAGLTKMTDTSDHKNSVVQLGAGYRF